MTSAMLAVSIAPSPGRRGRARPAQQPAGRAGRHGQDDRVGVDELHRVGPRAGRPAARSTRLGGLVRDRPQPAHGDSGAHLAAQALDRGHAASGNRPTPPRMPGEAPGRVRARPDRHGRRLAGGADCARSRVDQAAARVRSRPARPGSWPATTAGRHGRRTPRRASGSTSRSTTAGPTREATYDATSTSSSIGVAGRPGSSSTRAASSPFSTPVAAARPGRDAHQRPRRAAARRGPGTRCRPSRRRVSTRSSPRPTARARSSASGRRASSASAPASIVQAAELDQRQLAAHPVRPLEHRPRAGPGAGGSSSCAAASPEMPAPTTTTVGAGRSSGRPDRWAPRTGPGSQTVTAPRSRGTEPARHRRHVPTPTTTGRVRRAAGAQRAWRPDMTDETRR